MHSKALNTKPSASFDVMEDRARIQMAPTRGGRNGLAVECLWGSGLSR